MGDSDSKKQCPSCGSTLTLIAQVDEEIGFLCPCLEFFYACDDCPTNMRVLII